VNNDEQFIRSIVTVLDDRKGEDIAVIDLRDVPLPTSYFVVASADNLAHAKALVTALRKGLDRKPDHSEGTDERTWVVLDYGDVVVHLFQSSARAFYDLESLWADHLVSVDQLSAADDASSADDMSSVSFN